MRVVLLHACALLFGHIIGGAPTTPLTLLGKRPNLPPFPARGCHDDDLCAIARATAIWIDLVRSSFPPVRNFRSTFPSLQFFGLNASQATLVHGHIFTCGCWGGKRGRGRLGRWLGAPAPTPGLALSTEEPRTTWPWGMPIGYMDSPPHIPPPQHTHTHTHIRLYSRALRLTALPP